MQGSIFYLQLHCSLVEHFWSVLFLTHLQFVFCLSTMWKTYFAKIAQCTQPHNRSWIKPNKWYGMIELLLNIFSWSYKYFPPHRLTALTSLPRLERRLALDTLRCAAWRPAIRPMVHYWVSWCCGGNTTAHCALLSLGGRSSQSRRLHSGDGTQLLHSFTAGFSSFWASAELQ